MLKKVSIAVIAIFLLTSCGDDNKNASHSDNKDTPHNDNSSKSLKEKIEDLEDQGKLPKLDRTDSLAGIDENQNDIRDDIEKYIVENYPDEKQKKALFQFAKTMQASLFVDASDMISDKKVSVEMSRAITCIFSKFESQDVSDENPHIVSKKIESMTANTKARLQAYLKFNKAMDGTVSTSPRGDTCE